MKTHKTAPSNSVGVTRGSCERARIGVKARPGRSIGCEGMCEIQLEEGPPPHFLCIVGCAGETCEIGVVVRSDSPIGKSVIAPMVARAARGATGGGARAFEVGMAVKVPMPSTCAAAADRAPDFVPLRGAPFADKSCGPPAGRAKKSRVARRARAQEVPLDVAR